MRDRDHVRFETFLPSCRLSIKQHICHELRDHKVRVGRIGGIYASLGVFVLSSMMIGGETLRQVGASESIFEPEMQPVVNGADPESCPAS